MKLVRWINRKFGPKPEVKVSNELLRKQLKQMSKNEIIKFAIQQAGTVWLLEAELAKKYKKARSSAMRAA